jgi:hypothetical protein
MNDVAPVHDFEQSLARSQAQADAPWWLEVYRTAFPDLASSVSVREDGWAQRGGIDRVLTLASGRTLTIDEKVRDKVWPDILLELWSDKGKKVKGWAVKPLAIDYIAYAFVPSRQCYLLPFQTLRRAWRLNAKQWWDRYPHIEAKNRGYVTESIAIPVGVLMTAMGDAMRVEWSAP